MGTSDSQQPGHHSSRYYKKHPEAKRPMPHEPNAESQQTAAAAQHKRKSIFQWVLDHRNWAVIVTSLGFAVAFSQRFSTVGIWYCIAIAAVFLFLLIKERAAGTRHPRVY